MLTTDLSLGPVLIMTSRLRYAFRVTGPCKGTTDGFRSQRASNTDFEVFFGVSLSKQLNKPPSCWWFETPWRSLCHQLFVSGEQLHNFMLGTWKISAAAREKWRKRAAPNWFWINKCIYIYNIKCCPQCVYREVHQNAGLGINVGQNWAGGHGLTNLLMGVQMWAGEKKDFVYGTYDLYKTGHYTQVLVSSRSEQNILVFYHS